MDPATAALLSGAISGGASLLGGVLGNQAPKETKIQKRQRHMIDDLISSLKGQGPFSDLYNTSEETFQKSFVEPALSKFRNQVAPQIQQQFIQSGLQRGTGLEDQLTRAGVEMDQLLNQYLLEYQNQGKTRQQQTIANILGQPAGVAPGLSGSEDFGQAASGYLSSDDFSKSLAKILGEYTNKPQQQNQNPFQPAPRKGFAPDWNQAVNWELGHPGWRG